MRIVFFILLVSIGVLSCAERRIVSEDELKAYILEPANGLRKQTEKNGLAVEVLYRPAELVIAQQIEGVTDQAERERTIDNFDTLSYFVIKLSRNGQEVENAFVSDQEKFVRVINYLSSSIGNNIYMINDRDTIHALDAVYARMFGASSATSVMAVFDVDTETLTSDLRFVLDDTELGIGSNEFEFDINDIKKTPTLNLN